MIKMTKGILIEYSTNIPPLAVEFEFNVQSFSRSRTISVGGGEAEASRGGYSFTSQMDGMRAALGSSLAPETFSFTTLLDATDRMNDGDPIATRFGIQPEIDSLRSMLEPKTHASGGARVLASLNNAAGLALESSESISPIIFVWGIRLLPVFLTSLKIDEKSHLPNLLPYVAEATVSMQMIESDNPFYKFETLRQMQSSMTNTARVGAEMLARIF